MCYKSRQRWRAVVNRVVCVETYRVAGGNVDTSVVEVFEDEAEIPIAN